MNGHPSLQGEDRTRLTGRLVKKHAKVWKNIVLNTLSEPDLELWRQMMPHFIRQRFGVPNAPVTQAAQALYREVDIGEEVGRIVAHPQAGSNMPVFTFEPIDIAAVPADMQVELAIKCMEQKDFFYELYRDALEQENAPMIAARRRAALKHAKNNEDAIREELSHLRPARRCQSHGSGTPAEDAVNGFSVPGLQRCLADLRNARRSGKVQR